MQWNKVKPLSSSTRAMDGGTGYSLAVSASFFCAFPFLTFRRCLRGAAHHSTCGFALAGVVRLVGFPSWGLSWYGNVLGLELQQLGSPQLPYARDAVADRDERLLFALTHNRTCHLVTQAAATEDCKRGVIDGILTASSARSWGAPSFATALGSRG